MNLDELRKLGIIRDSKRSDPQPLTREALMNRIQVIMLECDTMRLATSDAKVRIGISNLQRRLLDLAKEVRRALAETTERKI